MSIDINRDTPSCVEETLYLPEIPPCDACDAFEQRLKKMAAEIEYMRSVMQYRLTAGANVDITDENVISAIDTTYLAGQGIIITDKNEIIAIMNQANTYNKEEVDALIAAVETSAIQIVDQLPSTGQSNVIYYLVENDGFDIYIYENNDWKKIGTSKIDLSEYQKKLTASTDLAIDETTNTIYHANSGVTAASKGDTTAQTPAFGGTFKVPSGTVNARGHLTAFEDHTVKIPNTAASTSAAGLMTAAMVTKLNGIAAGATKNALSISFVDFKNPSAVTVSAYSAGLISCTSGTAPSGYTYAGVAAFNTANVHLMSANVDNSYIRVKNTAAEPVTIAANAAYVKKMFIKIT